MTPHGDLISKGFALANPGQEYLTDEPSGGSLTVDLSASSAIFNVEWLKTSSGKKVTGGTVVDGGSRTLTASFGGTAVPYLVHK